MHFALFLTCIQSIAFCYLYDASIKPEVLNVPGDNHSSICRQVQLEPTSLRPARDPKWYAVYTVSQHEKSALKQLELRKIESFLPVYETVRVWKNRQRMKLLLPLFPSYLFVRIHSSERASVLQSPGVLQIVGSSREGIPLWDAEVEFLRSEFCKQRIEPYHELVIGEKVCIKSGVMQGLQGTLVRKNNNMRFVLTIEMINQHAAIQVNPEDLEPVVVST
jgi:transcription antitermination factor NusG